MVNLTLSVKDIDNVTISLDNKHYSNIEDIKWDILNCYSNRGGDIRGWCETCSLMRDNEEILDIKDLNNNDKLILQMKSDWCLKPRHTLKLTVRCNDDEFPIELELKNEDEFDEDYIMIFSILLYEISKKLNLHESLVNIMYNGSQLTDDNAPYLKGGETLDIVIVDEDKMEMKILLSENSKLSEDTPIEDMGIVVEDNKIVELSKKAIIGGGMPEYLHYFEHLRKLSLHDCGLFDWIPEDFYNLSNLKVLDLGGNNLENGISKDIRKMVKLEYIDLSSNNLTGNIPTEIENLINLKYLNLYGNRLSGLIPNDQLSGLVSKQLRDINLSYNNFSNILKLKEWENDEGKFVVRKFKAFVVTEEDEKLFEEIQEICPILANDLCSEFE